MQTSQLHAGTQVVVRAPVRGSGAADVHPRGAVGVITRTPVGTETHYTVRFPDGFETQLSADELEVLKHFKDRRGPEDTSSGTGRRTAFGVRTVHSLAPARLSRS